MLLLQWDVTSLPLLCSGVSAVFPISPPSLLIPGPQALPCPVGPDSTFESPAPRRVPTCLPSQTSLFHPPPRHVASLGPFVSESSSPRVGSLCFP